MLSLSSAVYGVSVFFQFNTVTPGIGRIMDIGIKLVLVGCIVEYFTTIFYGQGVFTFLFGGWSFNPIIADKDDLAGNDINELIRPRMPVALTRPRAWNYRAVQRSQLNFQLRSASAPARAAAYRS